MATATESRQWSFPLLAAVLCVLLGLLWQVPGARAGLEHTCELSARNKSPQAKGVCSARLAETVKGVCSALGLGYGGGSRSMFRRRLSAAVGDPENLSEEGRQASFLLNKRQALSYMRKRTSPVAALKLQKRQLSQGIVCECCYNRCSFNELSEYCVR